MAWSAVFCETQITKPRKRSRVKKKGHRIKNNVLCDDCQRIHYLSPTELGATHDKKIADEYPLLLPKGAVVRQDLGFLGHAPAGVLVEMPHKKPRNKALSFSELLYNQMLSSLRVVIEHVNSGIKRLRMLKDPIRLHNEWFRDTVLVVGCGLHNLRVASSQRAYGSHEREQNQSA